MPVPQHPHKFESTPILTPEQNAAYVEDLGLSEDIHVPDTAIIVFDDELATWATTEYNGQELDGFVSPVYHCQAPHTTFLLISEFGVGAPAMALVLEEVLELGVTRVVATGHAGAIQPDIDVGDWIICSEAIRDDGTSHHYLPADRTITGSSSLIATTRGVLTETGTTTHTGKVWSTDAPYRETSAEVRTYRDEGVLCVEMETAALYAIAEHRGVDAVATFVVSDVLSPDDWTPAFHAIQTEKQTLFRCLVETILSTSAQS